MNDHALEVRQSLTDPVALCGKLGWLDGHKRQARGVLIRCPSHGEKDPSCSVTVAPDGFLRFKCFACDWAGDALTAIALAHNLSTRDDFREVLAIGAELAGNLGLADEIRGSGSSIARPRLAPPALSVSPPPTYPNAKTLEALWLSCVDPSTDAEVVKMLQARRIDFGAVSDLRLGRVITARTELPGWAKYRGRPWFETGHRLLLPAYDAGGRMRSVRAWRVREGDSPKRLPPGGHKASELVQANMRGVMMLRRQLCPLRLYIVEGEPDALTASTTFARNEAVLGIGSGSWTDDFARAVPIGTEVVVATHADRAGDKYAEHVLETLGNRCPARRWRMTA